MLSLNMIDVKNIMNQLLLHDTFDRFLLCEAAIKTGVSYHIDGTLNEDFFNSDELETMEQRHYSYWREQRELILSIIKGKKTPLAFKFVLMLPQEDVRLLLTGNHLTIATNSISGLYLNIHFDHDRLLCTSGTSLNIFTMDKSLEQAWEHYILNFFKDHQLGFTTH